MTVQVLIAGESDRYRGCDSADQIGRGHRGGTRARRAEDELQPLGDARLCRARDERFQTISLDDPPSRQCFGECTR